MKKKTAKRKTVRRSNSSLSLHHAHPVYFVLFILVSTAFVVFVISTVFAYKFNEELNEQMMMAPVVRIQAPQIPSASVSPMVKTKPAY